MFSALINRRFFLGGSEVVEEEGTGRRWNTDRVFGVLDFPVDGMEDSRRDNSGEEARVEVSLTSKEAMAP